MNKGNLFRYFYDKRSELRHLRFRDILLARTVLDIHRHAQTRIPVLVPVWSIEPLHTIDRDTAMDKVEERSRVLRDNRQEIRRLRYLERSVLMRYMPSVSGIKIIEDGSGGFISFEGNGRVAAIKQVFDRLAGINIEAELYILDDVKKIMRRVNRVRNRNF